jgi:hypothetical protein
MSNFLIKALQDSFEEDNFMYVAGAGKMEA